MISCTIKKQNNGYYRIEFKERYLYFFYKTRVVYNLTENEVQKYKIPWCKIIREKDVASYICPQRIKF
jgi:hypothetical protein